MTEATFVATLFLFADVRQCLFLLTCSGVLVAAVGDVDHRTVIKSICAIHLA